MSFWGLCARVAARRRESSPSNVSKWWISQGHEHIFRRVRIKLNEATRDGATIVHILTNLPCRVSGQRVAELYRQRWTLETAFQHLEAYFV